MPPLMLKLWLLFAFASLPFWQDSDRPIHVFMIGDSTMADKSPEAEPERGWGQALPAFFSDAVKISNHAANGRSSKSFLDEGRWQVVVAGLQPGDYVLIQFGHNDQKPDPARHADAHTVYKDNLQKFVLDTRAKGATPVLCTSIVRRKFDGHGILADTHGEYPEAVRQVARQLDVPLLDLHSRTERLVQELGPEKSKILYLHVARGVYANRPDGIEDDTHLCPEGAATVARLAVEEMRARNLPLVRHLK